MSNETMILKGSSDEYFPTCIANGYATQYDLERTIKRIDAIADTASVIPPPPPPYEGFLPAIAGFDPYDTGGIVQVPSDYLQALETLASGMLQLINYDELLATSHEFSWDTFLKLLILRGHAQ